MRVVMKIGTALDVSPAKDTPKIVALPRFDGRASTLV